MLYTAVAAMRVVEGREGHVDGLPGRTALALVLLANLALMALPPAIGILVLLGGMQ